MRNIFKLFSLLLNILLIMLINGCSTIYTSWHQLVPNADIIFQSEMRSPYEINFILSDGSNHQLLYLDENFVKTVWSSDAEIIYGLSSPKGQWPYEDIGYPAYWNIKNGIFKRCDENLPYYGQIEGYNDSVSKKEVLLYNASEIIIYDLDSCKQNQLLVDFTEQTGEFAISGFSYLPETQELLYGRYTVPYKDREYCLIKLDLKTGEQVELAEGINPTWSPDGQQIAYLGLDGLYVIRFDGQQIRKLIDRQFFDPDEIGGPDLYQPKPYWSPDEEWLVYHRCNDDMCDVKQTSIDKVRVSDGMEVKIFTGGKFPSWRP